MELNKAACDEHMLLHLTSSCLYSLCVYAFVCVRWILPYIRYSVVVYFVRNTAVSWEIGGAGTAISSANLYAVKCNHVTCYACWCVLLYTAMVYNGTDFGTCCIK